MSFSFVIYDGPKLPHDPGLRKLIRQRAMKDIAAARRQRGDYGQHNLAQYPLFLEGKHEIADPPSAKKIQSAVPVHRCRKNEAPSDADKAAHPNQFSHNSAASYRFTGIPCIPRPDHAMSEGFFLLLNLMPLTGLRLGIATFSNLPSESGRVEDLFFAAHPGSRKVLSFIPSRYGEVLSLSHATDCVVAKLQQMMQAPDARPANSEAIVLLHYNKALRALRAALADEAQRLTPETLCATELLSVFEVLNGNKEVNSWIRHVTGAARLIEARGAHRFNTEFEMALFMAHVGPIVMEAFLSNTSCFLADEQWQQVIRSAICNDASFADQQNLVFSLWGYLARGPGLFKETTDIILSPDTTSQRVIEDLIERLTNSRSNLLYWLSQAQHKTWLSNGELERYGEGLPSIQPTFKHNGFGSRHITELTLRGTCTMCHILKNRLLYSLAPSRFHHLEIESQKLAGKVIDQRQNPSKDRGERLIWSSFMSQSTWIAKGILETREAWSEGWQEREGVIERWKFEAWCKAIGRTFP